jgi:hypothetical protein
MQLMGTELARPSLGVSRIELFSEAHGRVVVSFPTSALVFPEEFLQLGFSFQLPSPKRF